MARFWCYAAFFLITALPLTAGEKSRRLKSYCELHDWRGAQFFMARYPDETFHFEALETCMKFAFHHDQSELLEALINRNYGLVASIPDKSLWRIIGEGSSRTLEAAIVGGLDVSVIIEGETVVQEALKRFYPFRRLSFLLMRREHSFDEHGIYPFSLENRSPTTNRTALGEAIHRRKKNSADLLISHNASLFNALIAEDENGHLSLPEPWAHDKLMLDLWFQYNDIKVLRKHLKNCDLRHKALILQYFSRTNNQRYRKEIEKLLLKFQREQLDFAMDIFEISPSKSCANCSPSGDICLGLCDESDDTIWCTMDICGHSLCYSCMRFYLKTTTTPKIMCPARGCRARLVGDDLRKFNASSSLINRLEIKFIEEKLNEIRSFNPCHVRDCPGGSLTIHHYQQGSDHIECEVCLELQCIDCGECHTNSLCRSINEDLSLQFIKTKMLDGLIKKCPKCQEAIEKHLGCDHMQCRNCQHKFLWSA